MKKINYLKAIVIVHGKSEKQLVNYVTSNLRLNVEIISRKNGANSIQITSLKDILNNTVFKNEISFRRNYPAVDLNHFKLFIVMDTDDCREEEFKCYKDKSMFKKHWLYNNIIPIYNSNNLEDVLEKSKIPFKNKGIKRKEEYISLFPIGNDLNVKKDIETLYKKLKNNSNTNMEDLLDYFLNLN